MDNFKCVFNPCLLRSNRSQRNPVGGVGLASNPSSHTVYSPYVRNVTNGTSVRFATLAERIDDSGDTFNLQRLSPDAEPYAAVLSLHPRYEYNDPETLALV